MSLEVSFDCRDCSCEFGRDSSMLEVARKSDARFFYASSSEVYGDPEVFPTPESYEGKVAPLGPRSC